MMFPDLDEEVTPEVGDEYVHASVMLPCVVHGTVRAFKQGLDGNPIGCWSDSPILDMHLYDMEFPDGEVTPVPGKI